VTTLTEPHQFTVSDIDVFVMFEFIVQNMMNPNLIDEGSSHVVARWMHGDRDQWFGSFSDWHVFQDEILSGHFTCKSFVVPEADGAVFLWACKKKRSLGCNINWRDLSRMEAFANEIKLNFFIQVFIQTNWLYLNNSNVVILLRDSNIIFTWCTI